MRSGSLTVRPSADRDLESVCALEAGTLVPAVSVPCEYGTCALGFVPRLSEFCLQVSNLLQLGQTKSVPTNG